MGWDDEECNMLYVGRSCEEQGGSRAAPYEK